MNERGGGPLVAPEGGVIVSEEYRRDQTLNSACRTGPEKPNAETGDLSEPKETQ